MTAPVKASSWTEYLGFTSLLLFALAVPFFAFFNALTAVSWFGAQSQPGEREEQFTWLIVGIASNALAIVLALIAAAAGKKAARVLAAVTVPIALVGVVFLGYVAKGTADMLPDRPAAAEQSDRPTCGPDSRPAAYGGDSRYTVCPDDEAAATVLLAELTAELPLVDVTTESVDAAASAASERLDAPYLGTREWDNGDITAAWSPGPVTCAVALWRDGAWTSWVEGATIEHECIYTGS